MDYSSEKCIVIKSFLRWPEYLTNRVLSENFMVSLEKVICPWKQTENFVPIVRRLRKDWKLHVMYVVVCNFGNRNAEDKTFLPLMCENIIIFNVLTNALPLIT